MVCNIRHLIILVFRLPPDRFFPLSSAPLHRLSCSLASFTQSLPSPSLSFFHIDLAWLTSSVAPHPEVELIEPTSVASPQAGISLSSIMIAKRMGQGGSRVPTQVARHQWHTAQHIANLAQIEAWMVGAAQRLALSKIMESPFCCICGRKDDRFEGAEKNQRQLYRSTCRPLLWRWPVGATVMLKNSWGFAYHRRPSPEKSMSSLKSNSSTGLSL